ncbi:MAG TPA: non-ribosomal peptide synthetase [Pyrinomonadaceae bacterium]
MLDSSTRRQSSEQTRRVGPTNSFTRFKREWTEQSIQEIFQRQVVTRPCRIAVKTRHHAFTYRALNESANRLARAVLDEGKGSETVAILLEKEAQWIVAMLGVLKTGRLQVSLEPFSPQERIRHLLEDSQARLIVTNDRHFSRAKELAHDGCRVLNIDELGAHFSTEDLGLRVSPDALAFIIYTSGSTGAPKGVMLQHRTVLHRVMRQTNSFHICADDRLSHLGSFSAGQGLLNIFYALLNGAGLYPLDIKTEGLGPLASWLLEEGVTIYRSSASLFRYFIETLKAGQEFPRLRLVRLSSEPVTKRDIELCKKHFPPGCIFVNGLSTSETGIIREYFIDGETEIDASSVPVGYAVEDMRVLLLGETGREVSPGEVGQIAVKSRYLAPGYWRRTGMTEQLFLPDKERGDERLYLTGDMGIMLPGDLLVHAGRKDFQAKVRGHRIETAEIEMALRGCAAIREAVVMAEEDARGEQSLVAYLVPAQGKRLGTDALRLSLRERLPDYMIPSVFVLLDALPLTLSGKVDRLALSALAPVQAETEASYIPPRTPAENILAQIWGQVLGLGRVSADADFFMVGGHSLLAAQAIFRINSTFQIELQLRNLFESPTLSELALLIEDRLLEELEKLTEEEAQNLLARVVDSRTDGDHVYTG